jgi:thiol:disulfide interchange protein
VEKHNAFKPLRVLFLIILAMTAFTVIGKLWAPKDKIPWRSDVAAAQDESRKGGKPTLLYFTATWCPPCQQMKSETWAKPDVKTALQAYVPVKVDIDVDQASAQRYEIDAVPTIILLDGDGKVAKRLTGFLGAKDFLTWINS